MSVIFVDTKVEQKEERKPHRLSKIDLDKLKLPDSISQEDIKVKIEQVLVIV